MIVPTDEQETVVNYSREGKYADIYTSDKTVMTKLDKRVKKSKDWELIKVEKFSDGSIAGKFYRVPKKLISFRVSTVSRTMTDEQRKKAAERLREARKKEL